MLNKIHLGNCFDLLPLIPDGSVDAVITDPPYETTGLHYGFHSYKDEVLFTYDPDVIFENLPSGAVDSPLHLFGQMKGYFEI